MAKFVLTNAFFSIGGTDLSDHLESATLNYEAESQDTTAMSDLTRIMAGGLKSWSMDLNFRQDFAASNVDATLFPLVGTTATVILRADAGSVSATNPNYTGTGLVASYNPFTNAVGETANTPVSIVSAGTLSRATS